MAIFHLSAKMVSRATGRSSVAAAAYRSGQALTDGRQGQVHDYTRKRGVVHSEIVAPDNTPAWMHDREQLWNAVERVERRKDAQLARDLEIALPRELTRDHQIELVRGFVTDQFVHHGMIADFAIHEGTARDGGEQPHSHVMLTTRTLTAEGFGQKNRDWNATEQLEGWRRAWETYANAALEREGRAERIDHRSLNVQRAAAERDFDRARAAGDIRAADAHQAAADRLDREPEPKIGPLASQYEKAGQTSARGDDRRATFARNEARAEERTKLRDQAREIAREIAAVVREGAAEVRRRVEELGQRLAAAFEAVRSRTTNSDDVTGEPVAGRVISQEMKDRLLGRSEPAPKRQINRDALLSRSPRAGQRFDNMMATTAKLLGRVTEETGRAIEQADKGDRDRER